MKVANENKLLISDYIAMTAKSTLIINCSARNKIF